MNIVDLHFNILKYISSFLRLKDFLSLRTTSKKIFAKIFSQRILVQRKKKNLYDLPRKLMNNICSNLTRKDYKKVILTCKRLYNKTILYRPWHIVNLPHGILNLINRSLNIRDQVNFRFTCYEIRRKVEIYEIPRIKITRKFFREFNFNINNFKKLKVLDFSGCRTKVVEKLELLTSLEEFNIGNSDIEVIPKISYKKLICDGNKNITNDILINIEVINLSIKNTDITDISQTRGVKILNIRHCYDFDMNSIANMELNELYMCSNDSTVIPCPVDKILICKNCKSLTNDSFPKIKSLEYFEITYNDTITNIDHIDVTDTLICTSCGGLENKSLQKFNKLRYLDITSTLITELPKGIHKTLKILKCSNTDIESIALKNLILDKLSIKNCEGIHFIPCKVKYYLNCAGIRFDDPRLLNGLCFRYLNFSNSNLSVLPKVTDTLKCKSDPYLTSKILSGQNVRYLDISYCDNIVNLNNIEVSEILKCSACVKLEPLSLVKIKSLKILICDSVQLTYFPIVTEVLDCRSNNTAINLNLWRVTAKNIYIANCKNLTFQYVNN